ncbi:MAG: hypothetical protein ACYTEP_04515 [Planctomycetota bacterium]
MQAQEDITPQQEAEFKLHRYSTSWVDAESLLITLDSLFGRELHFADRHVSNLSKLDDSIVIYESVDRMERIMLAISQLDSEPYGEEVDDESEVEVSYPSDAMAVESYLPKNLQAQELYRLAEQLYGRKVQVDGSWHPNLQLTSNRGLIVYEELGAAKELLQKISEIDAGQTLTEGTSLVVREYMPRHVSANGLLQGLAPFRAQVADSRGGNVNYSDNISQVRERGLLIIRDFPERAEEILKVLGNLDRPSPQMMLTCQVLRGVHVEPDSRAPIEVENELRKVLPYDFYQVAGAGMLRAGMASDTKLKLRMDADIGPQGRFELGMEVGSFDPESNAIKLDRCELSMFAMEHDDPKRLFSTSATVFRGEYAVLGVTGAEPLFLVVQVVPIQEG